ncbi:MAG TPA: hypothetical protein VNN08_13470, partial [Thermoanaerobaculia bacterium]|nr:hypothetical protein [Thermoanaerobaculia bacterium]
MRTAHLFMTLLFLAVVGSVSAAPGNTLTVTTANHTITASGLTPGQTAVFYGVAQVAVPHRYLNRVQRWAVTVNDNGGTGTVTFDLQQDIPPASVWAVVDASNGNYGTVSGPGVGLREMATVGSGLALRAGAGTL